MKQPAASVRSSPIWLKNLARVRREICTRAWPVTPEEGLQHTLALSELGWHQILSRVHQLHPALPDDACSALAYRELCQWQRVRDRLRFRSSS